MDSFKLGIARLPQLRHGDCRQDSIGWIVGNSVDEVCYHVGEVNNDKKGIGLAEPSVRTPIKKVCRASCYDVPNFTFALPDSARDSSQAEKYLNFSNAEEKTSIRIEKKGASGGR
jgi:hypothetical protein